ncbi:MAG: transcription elongation factor Spt5 [Candidatus Poseidoniales archaeon]|jgi:transcriptional antiterminator NusG
MSDSYVAFVRHGEKLLLLRRSDSDPDFADLWDGVYGIGIDEEEIITRVVECTGIPAENLTAVRYAPARGVSMGNRLTDITPWLVVSDTDDVIPGGLYVSHQWIDPGDIVIDDREHSTTRNLCYTEDREGGHVDRLLRDMYGDVSSYLYVVKTGIGSEQRVAVEMRARLSGSGSLTMIQKEIFAILHPPTMRGYVMVESSARHHVERLIGRTGGRDRKSRGVMLSTPIKNAKAVLGGQYSAEAPLLDILPYLEPKAVTSGIEVGCIVEIITGAFKGEKARVVSVLESKEEVSMELYEADIPMTLNMRGDHVRVIERVE